jgi:hypothetical protein
MDFNNRFDILTAERDSIQNCSELLEVALELGISTNNRLATQSQTIEHSRDKV